MSPDIDADTISNIWLSSFAKSFASGNADAVSTHFLPDGYLRDLLTFSWTFRTLQGYSEIKSFLIDKLSSKSLSNFEIDYSSPFLVPVVDEQSSGPKTVVAAFTFETQNALGRGIVRLALELGAESRLDRWKAVSVMMMIKDWKGHEEGRSEANLYDTEITWPEMQEKRKKSHIQVLIVGAGHVGLMQAARLQQMGISCLIVEKEPRIGNSWRKRYPSLRLHVPKAHSPMLYQPFPSTWPTYTPKDKVGDWLELYATSQDLLVWTSSTIEANPIYDSSAKCWTIWVNKAGERTMLRPSHLIMAISTFGAPIMPNISGLTSFQGTVLHSSAFNGGAMYAGKHVIVVGAGNSATDICQDLHAHRAESITLLQRSPTCVVSRALVAEQIGTFFPEGVPVEVTDIKLASTPLKLLRDTLRAALPGFKEFDKNLREDLTRGGFALTDGPDDAGHIWLGYVRGGGYYIDSGFGSLVADGSVKVKSGKEISYIEGKRLVLSDTTALEADAIIFATGYEPAGNAYKTILGDSLLGKKPYEWGLNEECELKDLFRPIGQPGLWYAAGDFSLPRFYSKQLALLIKACEIGLYRQ